MLRDPSDAGTSTLMRIAAIHAALRRVLENDGSGAPTAVDLYRELQAVTPDSLQYLLHDLFEVNSCSELVAKRAAAERSGNPDDT